MNRPYPAKPKGSVFPEPLPFEAFATTTCHNETSFHSIELMEMWKLVGQHCPDPQRGPMWKKQRYFYIFFMKAHLMPTERTWKKMMYTSPETGGPISRKTFDVQCLPAGETVVKYADVFKWSHRLRKDNHHVLFPHYVTSIYDGFPITISEPTDKETNKIMTAGKYGETVSRWELGIDLRGNILNLHGPSPGCRNDAPMRAAAEKYLPMHPEERGLGDRAYKGMMHFEVLCVVSQCFI